MNNQAIVVKINKIEKHPNADKIALAKIFGTQVVIGKDIKVGDTLIYVDSNMKMSEDFLHNNNLYRHSEMNKDNTKSGFFEDNGRVKAIKMRGEISDGFLFPIDHLYYIHNDLLMSDFPNGYEFDQVAGTKFCEKYIVPMKQPGAPGSKNTRKKLEVPMFREHFDTQQFMRNKHRIPAGTMCYIEEKIHGTSHRSGHVIIDTTHKKNWIQKLLFKVVGIGSTNMYEYLNGTRRVIHTPKKQVNPYHDNTMREEVLEKAKLGKLFKGEQIYLELYGYEKAGGCVQKNYPYGCIPGQYRATMYRATMNNEDGQLVDYNREAVYARAEELGFEKPHLFEKFFYSGTDAAMEVLEERIIEYAQGQSDIGKGAEDTLKEGVVIWFINSDGKWEALKYKSDAFRLGESSDRDKGIIDQEDLN